MGSPYDKSWKDPDSHGRDLSYLATKKGPQTLDKKMNPDFTSEIGLKVRHFVQLQEALPKELNKFIACQQRSEQCWEYYMYCAFNQYSIRCYIMMKTEIMWYCTSFVRRLHKAASGGLMIDIDLYSTALPKGKPRNQWYRSIPLRRRQMYSSWRRSFILSFFFIPKPTKLLVKDTVLKFILEIEWHLLNRYTWSCSLYVHEKSI